MYNTVIHILYIYNVHIILYICKYHSIYLYISYDYVHVYIYTYIECKDVLLTPRPITTAEFQSSNGTGRWRHLQEDLDLEDYEEEEGPYQQRSLMMSI
jgi:hypothetical protein